MNRFAPHFGMRTGKGPVPHVEVITATRDAGSLGMFYIKVVKRCYGFTAMHATARAIRWAKAHGDPR